MKKLLVVIAFVASAIVVTAQEEPMFVKGNKNINLGAGLGYYGYYTAAFDFSASLDYCIADGILDDGSVGVGPFAGVGFGWGFVQPFGGVRGTFHYPLIEKLDTYLGLASGLRLHSRSFHFIGGMFIGANYPLNKNLTVFGELGSGSSCAGIVLKLK